MIFNLNEFPFCARLRAGCNMLHNACALGDVKKVRSLIYDQNFNFYKSTDDSSELTPLHYALCYKHFKVVDILLEAYRLDLEVIKGIKAQDGENVLLAFGDQVDKVIAIGSEKAILNWSPVLLKRNNAIKPDVLYIPDKPKSRCDVLIPFKRELKENGFCDLNAYIGCTLETALHIAMVHHMYPAIDKLLELGAEFECKIYCLSSYWNFKEINYINADLNLMKILCKNNTNFWQLEIDHLLAATAFYIKSFPALKCFLDHMVKTKQDIRQDECLRKIFNCVEPKFNQTFYQTVFRRTSFLRQGNFKFLYECLKKYGKYIHAALKDDNGDTTMHYVAAGKVQNEEIRYVKKLIMLLKESMLLKNNSGKLPVHVAAIKCYNVEIFKLFYYGTKCSFFQDFDFGMKIIVAAIVENNSENVRFLIQKHPDILNRGAAYISAAMINNEQMIDELLAKGIDPNIVFNGTNAFLQATTYVNDSMLKKLLATSLVTDVNFADADGRTVLLHICRWCSEEMFDKWMLLHADPFVVDKNGFSCLHESAFNSNRNIAKKLLRLGVDPLMRTDNLNTAIMLATSCNNKEAFRVLFNDKRHLDLHGRNSNGDTLLHLAASLYESEIFDSILSSGIDVNAQNSIGNTALHETCIIENAKKLLALNADYNIKNLNGDSVLYHSVSNYQVDKAIYLLKNIDNLDLTIKNNQGFNFLMLVTQVYGDKKYSEILKHSKYDRIFAEITVEQLSKMQIPYGLMFKLFIRNMNKTVLSALMIYLVELNYIKEIRHAIKRGANINLVNTEHPDETCLNCAISLRNYKLIEELLKLGCFIDLPNQDGVVPLQLAMTLGDYDIIDLLLKNKASLEKVDLGTISNEVIHCFNYLFE